MVLIGVVAGVVVAFIACATAVTKIVKWFWDRAYNQGRSDARKDAERADQERFAADVQEALRRRLGEK
jgi:cytochrome c-type biogenesis protein CcmH/NrfG